MRFPVPPNVLLASAKELNLYGNQIGDIGAEKLAEALPHLTNLTVACLGSWSWHYPPPSHKHQPHPSLRPAGRTAALAARGKRWVIKVRASIQGAPRCSSLVQLGG